MGKHQNLLNINFSRLWISAFVAAFVIMADLACKRDTVDEVTHHEYFDTVYINAWKIRSSNLPMHPGTLLRRENMDASMRYLDSAYNAFPNPGIGDFQAKLEYEQSWYLQSEKNYKKALILADSVLKIYNDPENIRKNGTGYAWANMFRGDALYGLSRYSEAYESFFKGRQIADANNLDKYALATYNHRLALLCYEQRNWRQAIFFWQECLLGLKKTELVWPDFARCQEVRDNIGLCYMGLNKPDSALIWYNKALDLISAYEKKTLDNAYGFPDVARSVVYDNIAQVYIDRKQYHKAADMVRQSLHLLRNISGPSEWPLEKQSCMARLARVSLLMGDLPQARMQIDTLASDLAVHAFVPTELRRLELDADYYLATGDSGKAFKNFSRYHFLNDSVDASVKKPGSDFTSEYKNIEQRHRLELLSATDKQKDATLAFAGTLAVVGIIGTALVWKSRKQLRHSLQNLTMLNNRISEQNTALQNTLTALQSSQDENNRLMRVVAHDLRNPVGAISSAALLLEEDLPQLDPEALELLHMIKISANDSLGLIHDLLQVRNDSETLVTEPVDLADLLAYCCDQMRHNAFQKKQHIKLTAPHVIWPVNREKMWRVISNLIANAIKFSPENSEIGLLLVNTADKVRIAVRDHGIGIPAELRETIFTAASPARRPGTAGESSFGLGLNICRQIVEAHGGSIHFENPAEGGTVFYVDLPKNQHA
ncbi:MAG: tetratricopeptide repeat-containing sensor histidine kinase [Bacteroidota bacterium]